MLFGNDGEGDAAKRRSSLGGTEDARRRRSARRSARRIRGRNRLRSAAATAETSSVEGLRSPSERRRRRRRRRLGRPEWSAVDDDAPRGRGRRFFDFGRRFRRAAAARRRFAPRRGGVGSGGRRRLGGGGVGVVFRLSFLFFFFGRGGYPGRGRGVLAQEGRRARGGAQVAGAARRVRRGGGGARARVRRGSERVIVSSFRGRPRASVGGANQSFYSRRSRGVYLFRVPDQTWTRTRSPRRRARRVSFVVSRSRPGAPSSRLARFGLFSKLVPFEAGVFFFYHTVVITEARHVFFGSIPASFRVRVVRAA